MLIRKKAGVISLSEADTETQLDDRVDADVISNIEEVLAFLADGVFQNFVADFCLFTIKIKLCIKKY